MICKEIQLPNILSPILQVVVIQACQESASFQTQSDRSLEPLPWNSQDKYKNQHITLDRPNTALLLATMRGGLALRGVFTGAMANQFRKADGIKDISSMFYDACVELKEKLKEENERVGWCSKWTGAIEQNPEFRCIPPRIVFPAAPRAPQAPIEDDVD